MENNGNKTRLSSSTQSRKLNLSRDSDIKDNLRVVDPKVWYGIVKFSVAFNTL